MLLTDSGLQITEFDTTMASLLGNSPGEAGANLLVEAARHQHMRVECSGIGSTCFSKLP